MKYLNSSMLLRLSILLFLLQQMMSLLIPLGTHCSCRISPLATVLGPRLTYRMLFPLVRHFHQASPLAWCSRVFGARLSSHVMTVESPHKNVRPRSKRHKAWFRLHRRMALVLQPIRYGTIVHFCHRTKLELRKKAPRRTKTLWKSI